MPRSTPSVTSPIRRVVALTVALALAGCDTINSVGGLISSPPAEGTPGHITGFLGGVVADEPRAALVAREVLSVGGNAIDAAVALGFALSVTLPSRAGLGGGGACLAYAAERKGPGGGAPEAISFVSSAPQTAQGSDRPAGLPMLARGLFAMHARYGRRPFETLISPAEQMARFGVPASRAFIRDLGVVAGPLAADPQARAVFFRNGLPLTEGATLSQPDLGATLAQLRVAGVGDLYQGALAHHLEDVTPSVGGAMTVTDLRGALPRILPALTLPAPDSDTIAFLPPPADGGLATAGAYQVLAANPAALDAANNRALGLATQLRQAGGDAQAMLAQPTAPAPGLPLLPASTTFATLDKDGNAVACALTMNNLFGTGRIAPGTGIVLAASPAAVPPPLLSAAIVWNNNLHAFRAAVGGSGQAAAPLAATVALVEALADHGATASPMPTPVPDPGRANVIECSHYLPDAEGACGWATDPRGAGLAIGSN
jgi:gamma-glutamyltranspeptidase/glutathione hydrolase